MGRGDISIIEFDVKCEMYRRYSRGTAKAWKSL